MQSIIPIRVGNSIEKSVHLTLAVSFFIVSTVVEQGQCIREKIIVQAAVTGVQPFVTKIFRISFTDESSTRLPFERYAIKIMGTTISFAGKPNMNAVNI